LYSTPSVHIRHGRNPRRARAKNIIKGLNFQDFTGAHFAVLAGGRDFGSAPAAAMMASAGAGNGSPVGTAKMVAASATQPYFEHPLFGAATPWYQRWSTVLLCAALEGIPVPGVMKNAHCFVLFVATFWLTCQ
jgi:hypothetical protein